MLDSTSTFRDQLDYITSLQQELFSPHYRGSTSSTRASSTSTNPSNLSRDELLTISGTNGTRRRTASANQGIFIPPTSTSTTTPIFNYSPTPLSLPPPPPLPAPVTTPPIALHRVYYINCNHCQTFLSDRGMRAVLLLKPHIILFSTDVAPINSGPLVNPIERLPLASSYKNSKRNLKNHMAGPESVQEILGGEEGVMMEKTCDCSTTAIACYGCGGIVGYHIVQPCSRCSESVKKHQRSANHHRYVFHAHQVVARERKFYPGEVGVKHFIPVTTTTAGGGGGGGVRTSSSSSTAMSRSSSGNSADGISPTNITGIPRVVVEEDLTKIEPLFLTFQNAQGQSYRVYPTSSTQSQHYLNTSTSSTSTLEDIRLSSNRTPPNPAFQPSLKPGETVYWHLLVSPGGGTVAIDPDSRPKLLVERPAR